MCTLTSNENDLNSVNSLFNTDERSDKLTKTVNDMRCTQNKSMLSFNFHREEKKNQGKTFADVEGKLDIIAKRF